MLVVNLMLMMSSAVLLHLSMAFTKHWQYIIVGAGPAGLQMGYYLQHSGRDYVILERSDISGSFFTVYPRHNKLISINKRHTGKTNKEFNLRHDWNSLISDDEALKFSRYSRDFFPHRLAYVRYLNDFERKLGLKVIHNTDVRNISRANVSRTNGYRFTMTDQHGNEFLCKTLIIGTGMWLPNIPKVKGIEYAEGYETVSTEADRFEGQSVLILGRGNAAFEVANHISGYANHVHLLGRSRVRLSWSTHYVGDLRAINNNVLDTYQLKSLDALLEASLDMAQIEHDVVKFRIKSASHPMQENLSFTSDYDNFAMREPYDRVIRCLGFRFNESLFNSDITLTHGHGHKAKYPKIYYNYESVDVPDMFFVGTVTHSLDLRKSAGGFVHGFRYSSRALHRMLEQKNHAVSWPSSTGSISDLIPVVVKRINEASGIYQMFGLLGDVIALRGEKYEYFEEFPVNLLHEFEEHVGKTVGSVIVVLMEYGANFSGPAKDTFRIDRATEEPSEAHLSNFLHPVFYYYKKLPTGEEMARRSSWENLPRPTAIHHIVEDFLTKWDAPISHIQPFRMFLENILSNDLRYFAGEECLVLSLTHSRIPSMCSKQFLEGQTLLIPETTLHAEQILNQKQNNSNTAPTCSLNQLML